MSVFKVKYLIGPMHVYCRVFAADRPNTTYRALGNLIMGRGEEFDDFCCLMAGAKCVDDSQETTKD